MTLASLFKIRYIAIKCVIFHLKMSKVLFHVFLNLSLKQNKKKTQINYNSAFINFFQQEIILLINVTWLLNCCKLPFCFNKVLDTSEKHLLVPVASCIVKVTESLKKYFLFSTVHLKREAERECVEEARIK